MANPLDRSETTSTPPSLELPNKPQNPNARGTSGATRWFFALGAIGLMGTAGVYSWPHISNMGKEESREGWETTVVQKKRLVISITEPGNIESASNVDVKCEVLGGSTILSIVQDGKKVQAGEEIVRLDDSPIDTQLNTQKIATEKAAAVKIQAEQDFEAAKIAVEEYEKGTFVMDKQTMEANVKIALENLRGAENLFNHTERMFKKGFVTKQQLESDEFGVQRSKLELQSAETALSVLQEFTKRKTLTALIATRDAAEARMRSDKAAWDLEVSNQKKLEIQKKNCVIRAPQDGMVIYANETSRRSSSNVTIEEGAAVRERQTIIKLPDLTSMQVRVTVHEAKIEHLRVGMPATVRVQNRKYLGKVISVANQPEPKNFFSADVKKYATKVAIEGATQNLKPGMTADVEIFVADIPNALTVDVAAVVEKGVGKNYAWVVTKDGLEKRELVLGRTNDEVVQVKDGLLEDEEVLLNPRAIVKEASSGMDEAGIASKDIPEGIPDGSQAPAPKKPASPPARPKFSDLDKDGDNKLTKDEAPERMQQFFDKIDKNQDGFVDQGEWSAMQQARKQAQGGG